MTEVTSGFKHSQLNDTRLITKYAYHYLKSVFSKVEVQKGSVTADFRKMLGVQSVDEKKSRDKHSHHAVDASILSLIPTAAKRDKMLELFYKIQEEKKLNNPTEYLRQELEREIRSCNIGNISNLNQHIEDNILINHVSKDQTLTPAKRKARRRGKVIWIKDENKKIVRDENGNNVPKRWITGDCIRGQLHKESFLGAIKYPILKDNKLEKDEQGKFIYEKDKNGEEIISIVMRVPINSFSSEKEFEKIIDPHTKFSVQTIVQRRIQQEGKTFNSAINEPIWLLDKKGNEKKLDKIGRLLSPIRHVRCRVAAGKGYFTSDKALKLKGQTYQSVKKLFHLKDRSHKSLYYAQNDENYLCLLYEFENKKKKVIERKFKLINYFEITEIGIQTINEFWEEPYFKSFQEKDKIFDLTGIIKAGHRVLMKNNDEEILSELSLNELYKRLFVVYKFNLKGSDCIYLKNHIEARKDIKDDFTEFNSNEYQAKLCLVANNFRCLIENRDFKILLDGKIIFKNH
jgi:CRISPR-associated endonuclease Csn1